MARCLTVLRCAAVVDVIDQSVRDGLVPSPCVRELDGARQRVDQPVTGTHLGGTVSGGDGLAADVPACVVHITVVILGAVAGERARGALCDHIFSFESDARVRAKVRAESCG